MRIGHSQCAALGFAWLMIFALVVVGASAAQLPQRPPSFSVGSVPGFPGSISHVAIIAARVTNTVAAQFDLAYDPSRLSSRDVALSSRHREHIIRSREIAPGKRRTLIYSMNNARLQTNGFGAEIPFRLVAGERSSGGRIQPENVHLVRRDGSEFNPAVISGGTIFVTPVFRLPDGTAQLFLPAQVDNRYVIQATSDFVTWVNFTNLVASGTFMDLVDEDARDYPQRFYRWASYDVFGELVPVQVVGSRDFVFQVNGLIGGTYEIESSTNLIDWSRQRSIVVGNGTLQITNTLSDSEVSRFYRLKLGP